MSVPTDEMRTLIGDIDRLAMKIKVERDQLLRCLKYMRADLSGCLSAFPEGMREAISNTNYNILVLRVEEADALIAELDKP